MRPARREIRTHQAFIAFAILTGARDGALASIRLKHIDMCSKALFQDAREVRTKVRKTFTTIFFPVGPEPLQIVTEYVAMLRNELALPMTTPFSLRRKSGAAKIVDLLSKGCLDETRGVEPGRFERFSGMLSNLLGFPMPTLTVFVIRLFALVSASAAPLRNGKSGARIWAMKMKRRHLSATARSQRIATPKSCERLVTRVLILCRLDWTSRH
jgi:hypothetical protein